MYIYIYNQCYSYIDIHSYLQQILYLFDDNYVTQLLFSLVLYIYSFTYDWFTRY